jgi:hypothetical protein
MDSAKQRRQQNVDLTNLEMRSSGFEPDPDLLELQRQYIDGNVSVADMIDWMVALMRDATQDQERFPAAGTTH